jgi:hypothetical protein
MAIRGHEFVINGYIFWLDVNARRCPHERERRQFNYRQFLINSHKSNNTHTEKRHLIALAKVMDIMRAPARDDADGR